MTESAISDFVTIVEVGPRDGLQNEKTTLPAATKIELIERLANCGAPVIETGSFVSPKWVPQMADTEAVVSGLTTLPGTRYPVLVPNLTGFERALKAGASEIAVFAAASESFSQRNTNCSIAESITRLEPVMQQAKAAGIPVRGYVSCVLGCPYEGYIEAEAVTAALVRLRQQMNWSKPSAPLFPSNNWPCISTIPTDRRWPIFLPAWTPVSAPWTHLYPDWVAALMPRVPAAMWPARMWCICCMAWVLPPALTWTHWP